MKKIKIGYLPMYLKLYDDTNPAKRDPMIAHMKTLISMLEAHGMEVAAVEPCRVREEFDAAVRRFEAEEVVAVVTQHLAYSPSLESIDALKRLRVPLIILDTTPEYSLIDKAAYEKGISDNHGIHGVQDMCNLLRRNGCQYHLCVGHALYSPVVAEVAGFCRAAQAAWEYRHARVGSVGRTFPGMGDFQIPEEQLSREVGAKVIPLSRESAEQYLAQVTPEDIDAEIAENAARFTVEVSNTDNYRESIRSGLAVRKWVDDQRLTAMTVNFLDVDACKLPKMPFVECSKVMARGVGYAGEGDVLTAGLVGALRSVYPLTTFTEVFCPDWKHDVLLLSHMGEANVDLAQWKPVLRDVPFNFNSCGDTVAAYTCLRPGKAALVNLAPMEKGLKLIIIPVEMLDRGLEYGAYRYAVQGWMKTQKPLREFLKAYSIEGGTHHSALVYDADMDEMEAFGRMMGFEVVRF